MIKIPYGISNFERLIEDGFHFIDKTPFIERLEKTDTSFNFLMRPRRFGKSLTVSMLWHYYGVEYKEKFGQLFGKTYIGANPTPRQGNYRILHFDFSRINTQSRQGTFDGFLHNVAIGIESFLNRYPLYTVGEKAAILAHRQPAEVIGHFFSIYEKYADLPIYLLIDEYDHFANEILAFDFHGFADMVSRNGFVRKFYESIKVATFSNVVERMFVTGVTPITLDSLTSGFNIRTDLSREAAFNEMMGFTEAQVAEIIEGVCEGNNCDIGQIVADMRSWYNGYLFAEEANTRLYNSDMVLYFARYFKEYGKYPKDLVDSNIASDYGKMRGLFNLVNPEQNYKILDILTQGKEIAAEITNAFSFEREFTPGDFSSLLYYMGFVTIKSASLGGSMLGVPNYVIWRLYVQFAGHLLEKRTQVRIETWDAHSAMLALAQQADLAPLLSKMQETLKALSVRDAVKFDEKHLKMVFVTLVNTAKFYFIRSETEVQKRYADLMLLARAPYEPPYEFAFEFKYVKKEDAHKAQQVLEEGKAQLKGYLSSEEWKNRANLKGYVVVFVYDELFACEGG